MYSFEKYNDDQEEKLEKWLSKRPICQWCKEPIEDEKWVNIFDLTFHRKCARVKDNIQQIWDDHLESEYLEEEET